MLAARTLASLRDARSAGRDGRRRGAPGHVSRRKPRALERTRARGTRTLQGDDRDHGRLTSGDKVTVGSDHDFRNRLVIDYYGEERPAGKTIVYVPAPGVASGGAEWFLTHTIDPAGDVIPPPTISPEGTPYVWVRSFKYGGSLRLELAPVSDCQARP